ncbi:MAG: CinA family nicotinamide mononucleotide deamidase-related protein [Gammaproteobacteria bacterium]|nr:CinA family nicotinamide mononucleotide deamidase-related protein [Gammaproteobacteria bacterium]
MQIQLLMTGNELMTGVTVDSNSAFIAQTLVSQGLEVHGKVTVGDDLPILVDEINRLSNNTDILIINGGLGPTVDDRTAEALAGAASVELVEHRDAMAHLLEWCDTSSARALNDANRKQAMLPAGCFVLPNTLGSAVGFWMELNNCLVLCTPGVPSEMRRMLQEYVMPLLRERFPNAKTIRQTRFHVFGLGESRLQQWINDAFPDWPTEIDLGFRAGLPTLEIKLTSPSGELDELHDLWCKKLTAEIGDNIVSEGDVRLSEAMVRLLANNGKTITTAESCTGGLIASTLTTVSGSSDVFEAGFVTYSNGMKTEMLGVNQEALETHGAVSEAVVREMVAGALQRSGADFGVAVSGVAGPTGGSDDKPVGTVWLAWGSISNIKARKFFVPRNRIVFQQIVAALGLDLIRREILGIKEEPDYYNG